MTASQPLDAPADRIGHALHSIIAFGPDEWRTIATTIRAPSPRGCLRKFQRTTALDPIGAVCERWYVASDAVRWRWVCSCRRQSTKLWTHPAYAYGPSRGHARRCFGRVRVDPVLVLPTCTAAEACERGDDR